MPILVGDDSIEVRVPETANGTLKTQLVDEGARVTAGHPLLTFVPDKIEEQAQFSGGQTGADNLARHPPDPGGELAEGVSTFVRSSPRESIVAEVMDMKRMRPIALVGLTFLLGLATTTVTTLLYLLSGGLAPLLLGALALSVVAVALLYGERQLRGSDGFSG